MSFLIMPTQPDLPAYQFQIELEGALFFLDFEWNERGEYWEMSIMDQNEVMIIAGVRICVGFPLIEQYRMANRPKGDFIALDTSGGLVDPGAGDLGNRVLLMYRESTTVE